MARAEVPDTTVFIQLIRDQSALPELYRGFKAGRVWLSSVVVAEVYAGSRSREDSRLVDEIVDAMRGVDRLITPGEADWARAGRLINRQIRLRGGLRPCDHLADVLILLSAARLNGTVVTANVRHFDGWAALAHDAGLDVAVAAFPNSGQNALPLS